MIVNSIEQGKILPQEGCVPGNYLILLRSKTDMLGIRLRHIALDLQQIYCDGRFEFPLSVADQVKYLEYHSVISPRHNFSLPVDLSQVQGSPISRPTGAKSFQSFSRDLGLSKEVAELLGSSGENIGERNVILYIGTVIEKIIC
ncbi:hypothetical protein TNCV_3236801 [Trichonephila clavipes]|nr:hypothetical protein TNCV_3236801 [Trichonephila clavipes]